MLTQAHVFPLRIFHNGSDLGPLSAGLCGLTLVPAVGLASSSDSLRLIDIFSGSRSELHAMLRKRKKKSERRSLLASTLDDLDSTGSSSGYSDQHNKSD